MTLQWVLVLFVFLPDGQVHAYPYPASPSAAACVAAVRAASASFDYATLPEGAKALWDCRQTTEFDA
jgi:hypothetical protein